MDGSGSSVTSVADVLEEHRIQRWVRKLSNRLWHTSTSGLDGNVVVLLEIDTSVLLGGVILLAEELLLHAHVTAAGDVLALLPSTITEGLTGATVAAARSSSAMVAIGLAVAPSTTTSTAAASKAAEATATTAVASISFKPPTTITAAGRRSGRAGVVPAVPVGKCERDGRHVAGSDKDVPVGRNRGIGGSPLRVPHMRRHISRFCSIDTERGWGRGIRMSDWLLL